MFLLSATAGVEPASLSYQSPTHSLKYATLRACSFSTGVLALHVLSRFRDSGTLLIYTVEISNSPRLLCALSSLAFLFDLRT